MHPIKKKGFQTILWCGAAILALLGVTALVLFAPLRGEKHVEIWSAGDAFDLEAIRTVEKAPDRAFKILLLTDTQLWMKPGDNQACYEQIRTLAEKTQPDLITTVGDNVSGVTSRFLLKKWIGVMEALQIPWAPVFGNHDNEIPMTSLNWQGDQFLRSPGCLFEKGPSNLYGCGNYAINITQNGEPVYTLFMLDNGRYEQYEDGTKRERFMDDGQIAWYTWNVEGIARAVGHPVPSMVFSHFAPPEMRQAVEDMGKYDPADGSYTIPAEAGFGRCDYLPGCAPVNSGFFDRCKTIGSTTHLFFGHDHENNAVITRDGITMAYGMKTGPSPAPWNFAQETGGTLITIHTANGQATAGVEHIPLA